MIEKDRLITSEASEVESNFDRALRPKKLKDYIGQSSVKEQMEIFINAAIGRHDALDHTLIFGPPGLGKTTLANVICNELGVNLHSTSGPILERPGDLAAILTNLGENDVLFIDEIHRLNTVVEEVLYPAMEDFHLDIMVGEGVSARSIKLDLPSFTLIGATTRAGSLTSPLRDRFGIIQRLEFYNPDELSLIIKRASNLLDINIDSFGATEIAKRSRGTPRIANRLLRRVRDFSDVKYDGQITALVADEALDILKIDPLGFDQMDRKLLLTIINKFNGGPVGVENLATAISEERSTIEDVLEPFLIQQGFLQRTQRGRTVTERAYDHFNIVLPN